MIDEEKDGIVVDDILIVDKIAEMFILGCTVDYVKEFGGSYLKVINPNAKAMWMRKFCDLKYYHDYLVSIAQEQKMLLNKHDIPFEEKLVTDQTEMDWLKRQGFKTFPIIYDENETHIGGYEELKSIVEDPYVLITSYSYSEIQSLRLCLVLLSIVFTNKLFRTLRILNL